jgi:circadian clock protein KaiC
VPPASSEDGAHRVRADRSEPPQGLRKTPTGIVGLDQVLEGGLPQGRTTLVSGGAGTGKTLLALEFLTNGAETYGEPGLFLAFEETSEELRANVASLGFDLPGLVEGDRLRVDEVRLDRMEMSSSGSYDLEGLFVRMGHAIDAIGAKRVVLDTVDVLFGGLLEPGIVRAELIRLFRWLKDRGLTAIVTAERGDGELTRHGLEEFVADCVIVLDHRVEQEASVRRLRVVKYRGSAHGTDEYPFLIDDDGLWVNPVTSVALDYAAPTERVSTGIPDLDEMLGGSGVYRGGSVLLSGTAGTGKTSVAASFVDAACRRGESSVYFSFEESPDQIVRDLRSIGLDLQPWIDTGMLHFRSARPTVYGLEKHLSRMLRLIDEVEPDMVVVDPITTFTTISEVRGISSTVTRLMDACRSRGITSVFTSLNVGGRSQETTDAHVSSVADVWLVVRDLETDGERNRALYVLKARGLAHSNQVREFVFGDDGIALLPVHVDTEGVRIGSARVSQEARRRLTQLAKAQEAERARRELELLHVRRAAAITALEAEFAAEESRMQAAVGQTVAQEAMQRDNRRALELHRTAWRGPAREPEAGGREAGDRGKADAPEGGGAPAASGGAAGARPDEGSS